MPALAGMTSEVGNCFSNNISYFPIPWLTAVSPPAIMPLNNRHTDDDRDKYGRINPQRVRGRCKRMIGKPEIHSRVAAETRQAGSARYSFFEASVQYTAGQ